jgi:hypothetical protein
MFFRVYRRSEPLGRSRSLGSIGFRSIFLLTASSDHFFVFLRQNDRNALFEDKYGETSIKRSTAGVSYFRIHTSSPSSTNESAVALEDDDEGIRSPRSTLAEISEDNIKLRESNIVVEKWFDIRLRSELVPMMQETHLVFVDIPGINEANTEQKYKDYVCDKWDTFDMSILVMDAKQGVNTEDSVFLLNLVKNNNDTKKNIRNGVRGTKGSGKIFAGSETLPWFIPISAMHAYIHQCFSHMSRESFEDFDQDLLEKFGREHIGRHQWYRLSKKAKA